MGAIRVAFDLVRPICALTCDVAVGSDCGFARLAGFSFC
jgi:hypothetical protein